METKPVYNVGRMNLISQQKPDYYLRAIHDVEAEERLLVILGNELEVCTDEETRTVIHIATRMAKVRLVVAEALKLSAWNCWQAELSERITVVELGACIHDSLFVGLSLNDLRVAQRHLDNALDGVYDALDKEGI